MTAATFLAHNATPGLAGSWYGHELTAFTSPLASHEATLTSQGKACQGAINDFSAAGRTLVDVFVTSPSAPTAILSQHIGITSVTNILTGGLNLCSAYEESGRAQEMGDVRGVSYSRTDAVNALVQTGFGIDYAVFRTANIGALVDSHGAAKWQELSQKTGLAGNILGGVLYTGLALNEGRKGLDSHAFKKRVEFHKKSHLGVNKELNESCPKTDREKIDYLRKGLRATEQDLIESEERHIWKADFTLFAQEERLRKMAEANIAKQGEALAIREQTGVLQNCLKAMRKHNIGSPGLAPTPKELEKIVRQRLGESVLQEHGKALLIANLKEKKIAKMTRRIGSGGVKELQKSEDQIVLANIEISHSKKKWGYAGRVTLYTLGAVGMVLGCIFTGGLGAILVGILLAGVFTGEAYLSGKKMQKAREDGSTPPDKYEKAWPIGSMFLGTVAIATAVILTSMFSLGVVPLAYVILAGLLWIGTNLFQLSSIEVRRKRHVEQLLTRDKLELSEFAYVIKYASCGEMGLALNKVDQKYQPAEDTAIQRVFAKLSDKDREDMLRFMKLPIDFIPESAEQMRARCQAAATELLAHREKASLKVLADELQYRLALIRQDSV